MSASSTRQGKTSTRQIGSVAGRPGTGHECVKPEGIRPGIIAAGSALLTIADGELFDLNGIKTWSVPPAAIARRASLAPRGPEMLWSVRVADGKRHILKTAGEADD
jgi:hypothetical protein